jgi:hypothetical protein
MSRRFPTVAIVKNRAQGKSWGCFCAECAECALNAPISVFGAFSGGVRRICY